MEAQIKNQEEIDKKLAERMSAGVKNFIELQESGRLEGKPLSRKDAQENKKPASNLEGRTI